MSLMLLLEEGPCPPLYSLGGQGYMKIIARYELRSPTGVLLGLFPSIPTCSTTTRVVLLQYEQLRLV
jgi:hypothetical protein